MDFSFEVNPDLDVAIGTELSYEDTQDLEFVEEFDFSNVDPLNPTGAKPGSEDKVRMLAARYAAGVPLWHDEDCYDHGPAEAVGNFPAENSGHFDIDDEF
ncbi:hypothetical protein [Planctomicrobium piriforme]|uniref:Uncharacterized protein n=1 Tax=Planctomicrobium piriforme TaxID=1576369 RepID=A0A1I3DL72_9PLAN|nr:hypothetical protein [Planctomicrobium piriforme]SFH87446.1 hypothetical protein SAMN05421753_103305 [Planctomicrobium piriforme]